MTIVFTIYSLFAFAESRQIEQKKNSGDLYEISSAADFVSMAEFINQGKSNENMVFKVMVPKLDFTGIELTPVYDFIGTFEGNGVVFDGIKSSGLFILNEGVIRGITISENCEIKDDNILGSVGGIVRTNMNLIEDCSNYGTVMGVREVGGIVASNSGTVQNCENKGSISGLDFYGELGRAIGGIAGTNVKCIQNCKNSGNITGSVEIGGIVGSNAAEVKSCLVSNCVIEGVSDIGFICNIGAVFGKTKGEEINNYYYDDVTVIIGDKVYTAMTDRGAGDTYEPYDIATQMGAILFYDFDTDFNIDNNGYIKIQSVENLKKLAEIVNDGYKCLGQKFRVTCSELNFKDVDFSTIGNSTSRGFWASFDGAGVIIRNLKIKTEGEDYVGLFGKVYGTISNIIIDATCSIEGQENVGGIAGYLSSGSIEACANHAHIRGERNVGGIAGMITGQGVKILNCNNDAYIEGERCAGGIVGNVPISMSGIEEISFSGCSNSGKVHGEEYIGGLIGYLKSTNTSEWRDFNVSGCSNSGDIKATKYIGGIIGYNDCSAEKESGSITKCDNSGNIVGKEEVGGIIGYGSHIIINNCHNVGNLSENFDLENFSGSLFGGIAGSLKQCDSEFCTNEGSITLTASYNIGGIAGAINKGSFSNSRNYGSVTGKYNVGGIIGLSLGTIDECINKGNVEGLIQNSKNYGNSIGGITGSNGGSIYGSINFAAIKGIFEVGGITGYNSGWLDGCLCDNCYIHGAEVLTGAIIGNNEYGRNLVANYYYWGTIVEIGNIVYKDNTPRGIGNNSPSPIPYDVLENDGAILSLIRRGDANGDGSVNSADIVDITTFMIGGKSGNTNFSAVDVNSDGKVNVADIVEIINIITRSE